MERKTLFVRDREGRPAPGRPVMAYAAGSEWAAPVGEPVVSDVNGRIELALPDGLYDVRAQAADGAWTVLARALSFYDVPAALEAALSQMRDLLAVGERAAALAQAPLDETDEQDQAFAARVRAAALGYVADAVTVACAPLRDLVTAQAAELAALRQALTALDARAVALERSETPQRVAALSDAQSAVAVRVEALERDVAGVPQLIGAVDALSQQIAELPEPPSPASKGAVLAGRGEGYVTPELLANYFDAQAKRLRAAGG